MTRGMCAATAAVGLLASGQAMAWQTPEGARATEPAATPAPAPEEAAPDGTTPEERANTARLNAEQASRARADNTIYAQEVSAAQQQVAPAQQVYTAETAAYEAEKARDAAMSAAERHTREADVAASQAGEKAPRRPTTP